VTPFIANTNPRWFQFLASRAVDGRVDDVNFWSPRATGPLRKDIAPGEPIFFRLRNPDQAIAGYGFFAHFRVVALRDAWDVFGWKNGDPDEGTFLSRIAGYDYLDRLSAAEPTGGLGCTILRDAHFWPEERWIPWRREQGWSPRIMRGRTETDPQVVERLLLEIRADAQPIPEEFAPAFVPLDVDDRRVGQHEGVVREGQGAFRLRLLDAYGGRSPRKSRSPRTAEGTEVPGRLADVCRRPPGSTVELIEGGHADWDSGTRRAVSLLGATLAVQRRFGTYG
jgi:putative restriction endonuclease